MALRKRGRAARARREVRCAPVRPGSIGGLAGLAVSCAGGSASGTSGWPSLGDRFAGTRRQIEAEQVLASAAGTAAGQSESPAATTTALDAVG
jgi:hypothetical protein